ncbi:MAG: ABC transporter substrate-binding protein [Coriobacteriia bacterium]|nr:ABC transporter substrate-binding protein [Coriobacteriia bacterium]
MTRSSRVSTRALAVLAIAALLGVALLAGCGSKAATPDAGTGTATETAPAAKAIPVRIGTLATEDSLPLWVAENMGYFATEGIPTVEIIPFQSAQERDVALASGAIDGFMGDIIAAANLTAGGKPVKIATVMLGADQSQGRFGVVVPPKSTVTDLTKLADTPVGTSSATIQEYVLDGLMAEAGISADRVKIEEVKKVPVRFELLMAGKLKAAALPEPFLTLAEQGGAKIVGDDTKAKSNLSQTVLVFSQDFLDKEGGPETVDGVLAAWDVAVNDINKDPANYRKVLVEKAKLPAPLAESYVVQTYPTAAPPAQPEVDAVLAWMKTKGYLKGEVTYEQLILAK